MYKRSRQHSRGSYYKFVASNSFFVTCIFSEKKNKKTKLLPDTFTNFQAGSLLIIVNRIHNDGIHTVPQTLTHMTARRLIPPCSRS